MIDGLLILWIVICLVGGGVVFVQPPRFRCQTCAATFGDFPALVDHEAEHRPRRCRCGEGAVHHPSCPTRDATMMPRRAVA